MARDSRPTGDDTSELIDVDLLDRAERNTQAWRRLSFALVFLTVAALLFAWHVQTANPKQAVVYKEDASGDLALMAETGAPALPTPIAVKHQIALWLQSIRAVPGDDPDLVQTDADRVLAMTAKGSPAFQDTITLLSGTQNPLTLGKRGYKRTISERDVDVEQISALTYRVAWKEALRTQNGPPVYYNYTGSVTLAQPPAMPDDPIIGRMNPAGVYLSSYDMAWSTL